MPVMELSVFLDNTAGRLCEVARRLGENHINIRGFSVADTADFGILRLLVNNPDKASAVLRQARFTVHEGPVVLARVYDRPGGFAAALEGFAKKGVNIDYSYGAVCSIIAFGVEQIETAEAILRDEGIQLVSEEELEQL